MESSDGSERAQAAARDRAVLAFDAQIGAALVGRSDLIMEAIHTNSFADDGYRSVKQWRRAIANCSSWQAGFDIRLARVLELMPDLAVAVASGRMGMDQIRVFADLYANPRCREHLAASSHLLVEPACTLTLSDFRQVVNEFELAADPDGTLRDLEAARTERSVRFQEIGNRFRMIIEGDARIGAELKEVWDSHVEAEFLTDQSARAEVHGNDAADHDLARTHAQRCFDAVETIFMKAAAGTDTTAAEPLVVLFATPEQLEEALRAYFAENGYGNPFTGDLGDPSESVRLRLCHTASGQMVHPRDLAIAALHGWVQRIVVDPAGHVINLGRRSRLFRGAARDAVLLNDRECSSPGCGARHGRQVDHLQPWEQFGRTDQDNAGVTCGPCNRAKHTRRFTVYRDETGWHYLRADGTEVAPRGQPHTGPPHAA